MTEYSEATLAFWEKVLSDAVEEEDRAWKELERIKGSPLSTDYDIKHAQEDYDSALKGRNLNELTVRGIREKLNFRVYKKPEGV